MGGSFSDSGWDLEIFLPQAQRNLPVDRYAELSCFGGLPLFSLFFYLVNLGRFRTSHFRETHGLSPFQGETMKLFVGNLPFSATEADLKGLFSEYGTVDSVAIITDRETGSTWSITGVATDGELTGTQLERIVSADHLWFSWAAFTPETRVWEPPLSDDRNDLG